jgi:hypothetical protein
MLLGCRTKSHVFVTFLSHEQIVHATTLPYGFFIVSLSCRPYQAVGTAHHGSAFSARHWPAYGFGPGLAHH